MICPLCGYEYDMQKAESDCETRCRLWRKCGLASCPNCFYERVIDPGWYGLTPEEKTASRKLPSDWATREKLYEEAVKKRVCEYCQDFGSDNACHSKDALGCAVFRYLPELVQIANEIHDRKIDTYVSAVRKNLCTKCHNSGLKGEDCNLRDTLDCGLDRYLPLVLDAIEDVDRTLL